MNWVPIEMKGYGKKLICFLLFEVKVDFFYLAFGPMKTLVEFIVKLCFTWSFMLNVQGMNCFENQKINVSSQWGFDSLGNFGFLIFCISFDDGLDDKCILKWVFICSFGVLGLFVMNI